jgi:hypothetical protein
MWSATNDHAVSHGIEEHDDVLILQVVNGSQDIVALFGH